jgi:hypothetical protein
VGAVKVNGEEGRGEERRHNGTLLDERDIHKRGKLHAPAVLVPGKNLRQPIPLPEI